MAPSQARTAETQRRTLILAAHAVECGLHSGIPLCCVEFFVRTWTFQSDRQRRPHSQAVRRAEGSESKRSGRRWFFNRIPCPKCLRARRRIRLLKCPPGGHPFLDKAMSETP